jgi:hypothetical protein
VLEPVSDHSRRSRHLTRIAKRSRLFQRLPDDLVQADHREPAQCFQDHWADDRGGQTALPLKTVRHGLTAQTVIGTLEDGEDYKAFEAAISADYDAQSAVERELVLRLASLLWRQRRATAIETGFVRNPS